MRTVHYFEFETFITMQGERVPVKVETIITAGALDVQEIEGVKVKLRDTEVEVVLSDDQLRDVRIEILERCNS